MILGLGTDVINIPRIEHAIERFGEHFLLRVYTPEEIAQASVFPAHNKRMLAAYYAKRFAAKEAAAKALGTGFRDGVSFQDFSISNDGQGKPLITFSGQALIRLQGLSSQGMPNIHLSLSDDYPSAFAVVVICSAV